MGGPGGPVRAAALVLFALAVNAGPGIAGPQKVQNVSSPVLGKQPLAFEPNLGQADPDAQFVAHTGNVDVALGATQVVFTVREGVDLQQALDPHEAQRNHLMDLPEPPEVTTITMRLVGGTLGGAAATEELPGRASYFVGRDPQNWHRDVPRYSRVVYTQVYPCINLAFYGKGKEVEYDFEVAAGGDPRAIEIEFGGMEDLKVGPKGDLVLKSKLGELLHKRAFVYQERGGRKERVPSRYVVKAQGRVGFELGKYDPARPLIIDPRVVYQAAVPLGSYGTAISVSRGGTAYLAWTEQRGGSDSYGNPDVVVGKLDAQGQIVNRSVYFGGTKLEKVTGIAVDGKGNVYIAGWTFSPDIAFGERTPYQSSFDPGFPTYGWGDVFVAEFDADLSTLLYSTYLGGAGQDGVNALAVSDVGEIVVTGLTRSGQFPRKAALRPQIDNGAWGDTVYGRGDAFVAKFNADGSDLVYSTFLGGPWHEEAYTLALDPNGYAYIAGWTDSLEFYTFWASGAPDGSVWGNATWDNTPWGDAFVAKFGPNGEGIYSTFFGGPGWDETWAIAADGEGHAYVTGDTGWGGFSTTPGALQPTPPRDCSGSVPDRSKCWDGFLTKIAPDGTKAEVSTYLGGTVSDGGNGIAVDDLGYIYVVGQTWSSDFLSPFLPQGRTIRMGFIVKLTPQGTFTKADGSADPRTYYHFFGAGEAEATLWTIALDGTRAAYLLGSVRLPDGTPGAFAAKIEGEEERIDILPSTTRWRAQKDPGRDPESNQTAPIQVAFQGPKGLTPPANGPALTITGPSAVPSPTLSDLAMTKDNGDGTAQYAITWAGPWTTNNGDPTSYLPRGDYGFVVNALLVDGKTSISSDPNAPCLNSPAGSQPCSIVSLVEVTDVKLIGQGARFESATGGSRIFPEAQAWDQKTAVLDTVGVIATVSPAVPDLRTQGAVTVYLRGIDVADPSGATVSPVLSSDPYRDNRGDFDANGNAKAGLFRASQPDPGAPPDAVVGGKPALSILADQAQGSVSLRVSRRQGDNYRVVASTSQTWVEGLKATPTTGDAEVVDQYGRRPEEKKTISELLTVWRTLHPEVDRMVPGAVTQKQLELHSRWTALTPIGLIDKNKPFLTDPNNPDHSNLGDWIGADLNINPTAQPPNPIRVEGNRDNILYVTSVDLMKQPQDPNKNYVLQDDLLSALNDGTVSDPVSLVAVATDILRGCYIETATDSPNATPTVRFIRNLPYAAQRGMAGDTPSTQDYWSVPVRTAFEFELDKDHDPDREGAVGGSAASPFDPDSEGLQRQPNVALYLETIRDMDETARGPGFPPLVDKAELIHNSIAHEILHTVALGDNTGDATGGIMCFKYATDPSEPNRTKITTFQRSLIRGVLEPVLRVPKPTEMTCPPASIWGF